MGYLWWPLKCLNFGSASAHTHLRDSVSVARCTQWFAANHHSVKASLSLVTHRSSHLILVLSVPLPKCRCIIQNFSIRSFPWTWKSTPVVDRQSPKILASLQKRQIQDFYYCDGQSLVLSRYRKTPVLGWHCMASPCIVSRQFKKQIRK